MTVMLEVRGPERMGSRSKHANSSSHLYVLQHGAGKMDDATGETLQPCKHGYTKHFSLRAQSPHSYANTTTIIPVSHVFADTKIK